MGTSFDTIRAWANAGTQIKPSNAKIDQGWLAGEQPPYEYENERMYTRDTRINEIIGYLNNGVPLDDILAGDVDINNSSVRIRDTAEGTNTYQSGNVFAVTGGSGSTLVAVDMYNEGIHHVDATLNSYCFFDEPLQFDISGLTWNGPDTDYGSKAWTAVSAIDLERPFQDENYSSYNASCVFEALSGNLEVCGVVHYEIQNVAGKMRIINLTVLNGLNPNNFVSGKLYIRTTHYPF